MKRVVFGVVLPILINFVASLPVHASTGVTLSWNPNAESGIVGYTVHQGLVSHAYTNVIFVGNTTNVTISGLAAATTNYFMVTTRNAVGLESAPSAEISYFVPPPAALVSLVTDGNGIITPDLRQQKLVKGRRYILTAVPATGQLFAGWTGDLEAATPRIAFTVNSNLLLQANFVTNPFIASQGKYNGLFYEADAVRQTHSGFFTLTVTTSGSYSGRLQIGAANYLVRGKFNLQGQATNVITRPAANSLVVALQLGVGNQADQISGMVSDGTWNANLSGDRYVFNTKTNPSPYAGSYTIIFPGQENDSTLPQGDGYGTVLVDAGGTVHFAGTLADGTKASQVVPVSKNGLWPLYVSLYAGNGSVLAWLAFTNQPTSDLIGQFNWNKPAMPTAVFYPAGFVDETVAVGSLYVPPGTNGVLNFINGAAAFMGGNLTADFTNSVAFGPGSKVTNLSSNLLNLKFAANTGVFTGSTKDVTSGKSLSFHGVALQKSNTGSGFLLDTNQSSRVMISAN